MMPNLVSEGPKNTLNHHEGREGKETGGIHLSFKWAPRGEKKFDDLKIVGLKMNLPDQSAGQRRGDLQKPNVNQKKHVKARTPYRRAKELKETQRNGS